MDGLLKGFIPLQDVSENISERVAYSAFFAEAAVGVGHPDF